MIYATIETFHQIICLQSSTMNSLLFIFPSLSSYFMSIIMIFSLFINEHPFKQEKKSTYVIEVFIR